jgi:hypothetical protein
MPSYHVDPEAPDGVSVEFLDVKSHELTISENDWKRNE